MRSPSIADGRKVYLLHDFTVLCGSLQIHHYIIPQAQGFDKGRNILITSQSLNQDYFLSLFDETLSPSSEALSLSDKTLV